MRFAKVTIYIALCSGFYSGNCRPQNLDDHLTTSKNELAGTKELLAAKEDVHQGSPNSFYPSFSRFDSPPLGHSRPFYYNSGNQEGAYSQRSQPFEQLFDGPGKSYGFAKEDYIPVPDTPKSENILGSGNFGVISGGTFFNDNDGDSSRNYNDYDSYFHNGHGRPSYFNKQSSNTKPRYQQFANFKDFADINSPSVRQYSEKVPVYVKKNDNEAEESIESDSEPGINPEHNNNDHTLLGNNKRKPLTVLPNEESPVDRNNSHARLFENVDDKKSQNSEKLNNTRENIEIQAFVDIEPVGDEKILLSNIMSGIGLVHGDNDTNDREYSNNQSRTPSHFSVSEDDLKVFEKIMESLGLMQISKELNDENNIKQAWEDLIEFLGLEEEEASHDHVKNLGPDSSSSTTESEYSTKDKSTTEDGDSKFKKLGESVTTGSNDNTKTQEMPYIIIHPKGLNVMDTLKSTVINAETDTKPKNIIESLALLDHENSAAGDAPQKKLSKSKRKLSLIPPEKKHKAKLLAKEKMEKELSDPLLALS